MSPLAPKGSLVAHVLHPTKGVFSDKIRIVIEPVSLQRRLDIPPVFVCFFSTHVCFSNVSHMVGEATAEAVALSFPLPRIQSIGLQVIGGIISAWSTTSAIPTEPVFFYGKDPERQPRSCSDAGDL
jgi:hypothetical protein